MVENTVLRSSKYVVLLSNVTGSYVLPPGAPTIKVVASDDIDNEVPNFAPTELLGLVIVWVYA